MNITAICRRAQRRAANDHWQRGTIELAQAELAEHKEFGGQGNAVDFWRERLATRWDYGSLPWQAVQVEGVRLYSRNKWGDIGEVELTYSRHGYRAIYGFNANGDLSLYAD